MIEIYHQRQIKIRVEGDLKRDMLSLLIYTLDELHQPFTGLVYHKLIPCNCAECLVAEIPHFYAYHSLQRRLAKGKATVECDSSFEDVSVQGLLDEVLSPLKRLDSHNLRKMMAAGLSEAELRVLIKDDPRFPRTQFKPG